MGVLLLVRHGQASFGSEDYDVLSETGWAQGRLLGRHLAERGVRPSVVVRGGMRRHRETVEALLEGAAWDGAPEVDVDAAWDEFDHLGVVAAHPEAPTGELDRREFQAFFERATARWSADEGDDAGYPESYAGFLARVDGAFRSAAARVGSGETVLVVSSGGPVAAVCARLVDPDGADRAATARLWSRFNTVVVNSSFSRVVVGSTGPRLLTFNEHPHLEGEHLTYR